MDINNFRLKLVSLRRIHKTLLAEINDFFLFFISLKLSFFLILDNSLSVPFEYQVISFTSITGVILLYWVGVYRTVIRYINFDFLWEILKGILLFSVFLFLCLFFLNAEELPKIVFLNLLLSSLFLTANRVIVNRILLNEKGSSRVAIYGAGSAGVQLANALKFSSEMQPVFFVDTNKILPPLTIVL